MARPTNERLRRALVADLRATGMIASDRVEAAFIAVPRERFLAGMLAELGLEGVYRDDAIVTKRDPEGRPLSSSSQPSLMAKMLELLDPQPGDRVLEVGAGTGYNAALLSHLVGRRGRVTTIDVDGELAKQAGRSVRAAGYRASIVTGDGRQGHPAAAPYDRIIVTACAEEVERAWLDQLAVGGRLALPLRLDPDSAAIQLIATFERVGDRLQSTGFTWGGFMPLHGGEGGWRSPPASLSANGSAGGEYRLLASLTGPGLARLGDGAARELLGAVLGANHRPRRQGVTDLSANDPPLLLLYLLLGIAPARRVSLRGDGRLGVGILHPRHRSLAVVSVRSPWRTDALQHAQRTRWRLDSFGDELAAIELDALIDEWQALHRMGRTNLQITVRPRAGGTQLSFAWA